jgi:Ca-activated chloride channel family protein
VAFYTEGRPVVVDTSDPEVVSNILSDLPLEHAFKAGKTRMYAAVEVADRLARSQQWPDRTAQFVLVSDGDTLPAQKPAGLPPAFGSVLIAGVGNPHRGTFIDGHSSRQDAASLQRLAAQLSGTYHDVNGRHVPSESLRGFAAAGPAEPVAAWGSTEWAIAAVVAGAAILALAPVLLAWFGCAWRPDRARPVDALVRSGDGKRSLLLEK